MNIQTLKCATNSTVYGNGFDNVGPFTVEGTCNENNEVYFMKQYIGKNQ